MTGFYILVVEKNTGICVEKSTSHSYFNVINWNFEHPIERFLLNYVITSIVGDDAVDISLATTKGKIIEHVYHKGNTIFFE